MTNNCVYVEPATPALQVSLSSEQQAAVMHQGLQQSNIRACGEVVCRYSRLPALQRANTGSSWRMQGS